MVLNFCAIGTRLALIIVVFSCVGEASIASAQFWTSCCFGGPCGKAPPAEPPIDLFLAMEQGSIQARMIVRSQYHARLILTNSTAEPQMIQIPNVLGARPILAQQQSSFFGPQSGSGGVGSTGAIAPQSVGGTPQSSRGSSSQSSGFPGFFSGSGMNNVFNIAPEQVRTIEIKCLCLEQGKPNPRSAVKYELVPLAEVNDDPKLAEVLMSYGRGEADREIAQAAAWHLANEMSWEKLAALSQKIALNAEKPWFSTVQLQAAKQLVDSAKPAAATSANKVAKLPKL
jgi:hypothetical protein